MAKGHGIAGEHVLRLVEALQAAERELLPLRALAADVDEFFDGATEDLFEKGHKDCRTTRRVADFYEHFWKPSAQERGYKRMRKTYGRGTG